MIDCTPSHRLQREERLAQDVEERRHREEEAQIMAEQERIREEAQCLQDEKEAEERAKIEQEENERLQKQVRNAAFPRILSNSLHSFKSKLYKCIYWQSCKVHFIDFPVLNIELFGCIRAMAWHLVHMLKTRWAVVLIWETWVQIWPRLFPDQCHFNIIYILLCLLIFKFE